MFWSEIGSGFGESGGTSPPKIPRIIPGEFRYENKLELPLVKCHIEFECLFFEGLINAVCLQANIGENSNSLN